MALRDELKQVVAETKPRMVPVPCPEFPSLDGKVFAGVVSPRAIAECYRIDDEEDALDERPAFVVRCCCDAEGSRIFQEEDVIWLATTPAMQPFVERCYWAGREVNGLTEENRTAWRKNSASMATSGLPCSSVVPSQANSASTSAG